MHVNPYGRELLSTVVDLVNTPPTDIDDIVRRWTDAGMPLENGPAAGDLELINGYLAGWRRMLSATDETVRVAVLNELLATYAGPPSVTDHDGSGWHIHYRPDNVSLGEVLTAASAVAAAEHLTARGMHRLGRCAAGECGRAFVDHSRPGRQRYCSHACANRDAVRRHRATSAATSGRHRRSAGR